MAEQKSAAKASSDTESKKPRLIRKTVDVAAQTVTFNVGPKESRVIHYGKFPSPILAKLTAHGASQKLGDVCAGVAKECVESGTDPIPTVLAALDAEASKLGAGTWAERSSGGSVKYVDLIEPFVMVAKGRGKTVTPEQAVAKLSEMTGAQLAGLRQNAEFAQAILTVAKSRKAPTGEIDSLFA